MNKYYMYLSDKEMLVIDENGNANNRSIETNNMPDLLRNENNLEHINIIINNLETLINSGKTEKLTVKKALLPLIVGLLIALFVELFAGMDFNQLLTVGFPASIGTSYFIFGSTYICEKIYSIINYKRLGLEERLEIAYRLKNKYEKNLNQIKSQNEEITVNAQQNQEIMSLTDSLELPDKDLQLLQNASEQKPKTLTLRKHNQR